MTTINGNFLHSFGKEFFVVLYFVKNLSESARVPANFVDWYKRKEWKNLDPGEKEKYRRIDNERLEKSRKEFIEKYLSGGEFEEKFDSDFDKVIAHVEKLFKVGCSHESFFLFFKSLADTMCKGIETEESRARRLPKHLRELA